MKYFNLLQQLEKDLINSLQQELGFTLQNEFRSDFAVIKSALQDKLESLKSTLDIVNLSILQAQVKKVKEIFQYLESIETQRILDRENYVQDIENELTNW